MYASSFSITMCVSCLPACSVLQYGQLASCQPGVCAYVLRRWLQVKISLPASCCCNSHFFPSWLVIVYIYMHGCQFCLLAVLPQESDQSIPEKVKFLPHNKRWARQKNLLVYLVGWLLLATVARQAKSYRPPCIRKNLSY